MTNQDTTHALIELEQHLQFQLLLAELSASFVRYSYWITWRQLLGF
ncbi:MAG: hypothetical protein WCS87_14050 [Methylococcaceae bacterium]